MSQEDKKVITVVATVHAPIETVWNNWIEPEHIKNWNNASDDWFTPSAESDFKEGGQFVYRMEAKDGSFGFDFGGTFEQIEQHKRICYIIGDGRKVDITFTPEGDSTTVSEAFEAESTHPVEMQQTGWQAIMDNFKKYVESKAV